MFGVFWKCGSAIVFGLNLQDVSRCILGLRFEIKINHGLDLYINFGSNLKIKPGLNLKINCFFRDQFVGTETIIRKFPLLVLRLGEHS